MPLMLKRGGDSLTIGNQALYVVTVNPGALWLVLMLRGLIEAVVLCGWVAIVDLWRTR